LALVSAATFGVDLYVNYAFANRDYRSRSFNDVTNRYMTQITPASWVFMIWTVIYGLLIIWYIYVFYLLLCRQLLARSNKSPLFPGIFWFIFIIVNVLNGVWIYCFLHNSMVLAGVILVVLTLMLYLLNMIAYRVCWWDVTYNGNSANNKNDVEHDNDDIVELSRCEIALLRFLTLNGLPLYAIWCTVATCLQWTIIFKYFIFHWSDNVSSIVTLSILSLLLLMYWNLDLLVKREYFVWTWSTYIALIVAFSAIIDRYNYIGGMYRPGLFFAFILLIVSIVGLLIKAFTLCLCPPKCEHRFSRV